MNYEQWCKRYIPTSNRREDCGFDGTLFETYGSDLEYVRGYMGQGRVWTLIEEDGKQYILFGMRFVNRLGYFITFNTHDGPADTIVRF